MQNQPHLLMIKIILWALFAIIILFGAGYLGKTTISEQGISVERPLTALLFILMVLVRIFWEK